MAIQPYVKFLRGTIEDFNALTSYSSDTLYFITDNSKGTTSLYLGNNLIAGSGGNITSSSLGILSDVLLSEIGDKDILRYEATEEKWINISFEALIEEIHNEIKPSIYSGERFENETLTMAIIRLMAGQEAKVGDIVVVKDLITTDKYQYIANVYNGTTWIALDEYYNADSIYFNSGLSLSDVIATLEIGADNKTIELNNKVLSLKDFGIQYYRYVAAESEVPAHYVLQVVDATHPWKAGLEPKVVLNDANELVIGWYEPNPTTIEGVNDQVSSLQTSVTSLTTATQNLQSSIDGINITLNNKANATDVYTKIETDDKIAEAVSAASHLKRKVVNKVEDIDLTAKDAEQYIYMVPTGLQEDDDKYNEYMVLVDTDDEGNEIKILEKVGDWEVNLSGYATKEDLNAKVDIKPGYSLVQDEAIAKLEGIAAEAEKNFINAVDENEFSVLDRLLNLNKVPASKLTGLAEHETIVALTTSLSNKVNTSVVDALNSQVIKNTQDIATNAEAIKKNADDIIIVKNSVTSVTTLLNDYVKKTELQTMQNDINALKEAITWQNI